jgi:ABC-type dipeptide/oligopeptide/nickel transport system ATPase component
MHLTMLFISHNLAVVRYVSDVVAVMRHGRIVECGPVGQVLGNPQHEYTRELLEAVPRPGVPL